MNHRHSIRALLLLLYSASALRAADFQYSVPMEESRRAYLWVPPDCRRLRGLIVDLNNLLDETMVQDPVIRRAAADEKLGIVWIADGTWVKSPLVGEFDYKHGADQVLLRALAALAKESGYGEVEFAPLLTTGHSATGPFAWRGGYWDASRVFAELPIKCSVGFPPPFDPHAKFEGVPIFFALGQFSEWSAASGLTSRDQVDKCVDWCLKLRCDEHNLLGMTVEWGGGHFEWSDALASITAMFIRKAAHYRLPDEVPLDRPAQLKEIAPESGWLGTPWNAPEQFPPAPYKAYKGDPKKALWFFDEEMARAAITFTADQRFKKRQMVTFAQDGHPLPLGKRGFVDIPFHPIADGLTFKLDGAFLPQVPAGLVNEGQPLGHAAGGTVKVRITAGSLVQLSDDTFRVRFGHMGFHRKALDGWMVAYHPGDAGYAYCVQPGLLSIPACNQDGPPQKITFPKPDDVRAGMKEIELHATSDSGAPVEYYIVSGPAEVTGNKLTFTPIPPRSRYPLKVIVVAYQWGESMAPKLQSAEPAEQIFLIGD